MDSGISKSNSVVLASKDSAIKAVCEQILLELRANHFNEEDIFAVHLALEEAFMNAIKHGNGMNPDKEVKIDYCVAPEYIEISLTDEGEGFNPTDVPDPRCGENIYKPEGRGLFLIQSYMDKVEFNQKGNKIHMVKFKESSSVKDKQPKKQCD